MKIAVYARVSSEKQEREETIESQVRALREYAQKNSYTIIEEYLDNGYSGELLARPALDNLRDDVKKKIFEAVLIYCPDRLCRKYAYQVLIIEELKKYGINIIYLNHPTNGDTPEDNLLNGVQGLIAEYEKAKITERTRRGKLHKVKNGLLETSVAPYGYKYISKDKNKKAEGYYELDEKEVVIVKLIFDLYVNHNKSIRGIVKELARRGISARNKKHWSTTVINRILRNETYTGITYYNKNMAVEAEKLKDENKYRRTKRTSRKLRDKEEWIPIQLPKHLQIIDKNLFDLALKQLKRNSELSDRNVKHKYLLRGLMKCEDCNSPIHGITYNGKYQGYKCANYHNTFPVPKKCKQLSIKASKVEKAVWDKICEAINNPKIILENVSKLKNRKVRSAENIKNDIEAINKKLSSVSEEESKILDIYREGVISKEQLKEQMDKIQLKKKELNQKKQDLLIKQEDSISKSFVKKSIQYYCGIIKNNLKELENDFEGKRYILLLAVNKILLDTENKTAKIKCVIPLNNFSNETKEKKYSHIVSQPFRR